MIRGFRPKVHFSLLLLLTCISSAFAQAHADPFSEADAVLTSTYKQALNRFAPKNQEVLRKAERNWITFSNKQEELLKALRHENLLSQEAVDTATIQEVHSRNAHLRLFFTRDFLALNRGNTIPDRERELQTIYAQCMAHLSNNDQALLRAAERSWIVYRDSDADSTASAYPLSNVQAAASADLTSIRVSQLTALMRSLNQTGNVSVAPTLIESAPSSLDDQQAVAQTRDAAKRLLSALVSKKDDAFFRKTDSIKNVPDLPTEAAVQLTEINTKFRELGDRDDLAKLLEPARNEVLTVELLATWSSFTKELKNGDVASGAKAMGSALQRRPKDLKPDYLPLWQTVEGWQPIYVKAVAEFEEHTQKAKSLAERGKNSDAIREYEASYGIIENSSVLQEIKKLREQSLGL